MTVFYLERMDEEKQRKNLFFSLDKALGDSNRYDRMETLRRWIDRWLWFISKNFSIITYVIDSDFERIVVEGNIVDSMSKKPRNDNDKYIGSD